MVLPLLLASLIPTAIDFFQSIFNKDEQQEFDDVRPGITNYNPFEREED